MIKCENCLKYLNNQYGTVLEPEGVFVNIKTKGFLTHTNYSLYLLVKEFELSFMIHADSYDVFEKTYETVLENKNLKLKWQCLEHKSKILTDVYTMYTTMRMRQHSYAKNQ
ncbi:THAP-type domain-containing protein [Aphis craccivora]|uniref:THAP-type domain-containing protein n=1 Tax=Aphis craccivora TaxID=307492 RepID=A0A6G0Y4K6_APHCR|nr:THAP-type domain-containing protein [Aphis craccivora]